MWELVIAALPCGGSPGFLDKLGMMGVWHYTPIISTEARARSGEIQALAALSLLPHCLAAVRLDSSASSE